MAPGRLVEVRVTWPEHPRYLKKKKRWGGGKNVTRKCKNDLEKTEGHYQWDAFFFVRRFYWVF